MRRHSIEGGSRGTGRDAGLSPLALLPVSKEHKGLWLCQGRGHKEVERYKGGWVPRLVLGRVLGRRQLPRSRRLVRTGGCAW